MNTLISRFKFLLFSLLVCSSITANAWNARGHMLVADIAYRNLSDSMQHYYTAILQQHPFYAQWKNEFSNLKDIPEGSFLFMKAATWPDVIRKSGSKDDHPKWHYITTKIDFVNGHNSNALNHDENILSALQLCMDSLKNPATAASRKAVYLSWIIHLIGDIHQPLHCGSLFNTEHPDGDKGGNDIWIHVAATNDTTRLHAFWDDLPGKGTPYLEIRKTAEKQIHQFRSKLKKQVTVTAAQAWTKESFDLAVQYAYWNGAVAQLAGTKDRKTAALLSNEKQYTKKAMQVARKQSTLAGLRLAKAISI